MNRKTDDGDIRDIASALRRRKLWLLAFPALFLAIAYGVTRAQEPVYEASATVTVEPPPPSVDGSNQGTIEGDRFVRGQRDLVESQDVRTEVINRLGEHEAISTSSSDARDVMTITAEDADAARAALIADTYAASYLDLRRAREAAELTTAIASYDARITQFEAQLAALPAPPPNGGDPYYSERNQFNGQRAEAQEARANLQLRANLAAASGAGQIVESAEVPGAPARPNTGRYLAVALLTGLIVGIAVALVRDSLDRSVQLSGGELGGLPGLPVLTVVPQPAWWHRFLSAGGSRRATAESFRTLRAVLAGTPSGQPTRLVQLVGPRDGRLAAEAVASLGVAFEQAGHRTLLVSADLRHPRLPHLLGVPREPGLVSLLLGQASLQDTVRSVGSHENLLALPPGAPDAKAPDLLASQKLTVVLEQLRGHAEAIFLEAPPVLTAADSLELATEVDGTVLVVADGRTKIDDVERALTLLGAVGGGVLGCVVYQTRGR